MEKEKRYSNITISLNRDESRKFLDIQREIKSFLGCSLTKKETCLFALDTLEKKIKEEWVSA